MGFLPSSDWPVGFEVNDWLAMPLPQDLPVESPLALILRLYEVESGEAVLSRRLGEIRIQEGQVSFQENEPAFSLPNDLTPLSALFGETIRLHGYQIDQTGTDLRLTLYWEAVNSDMLDYTRFVHLFNPETETVVAQNDGQPRLGCQQGSNGLDKVSPQSQQSIQHEETRQADQESGQQQQRHFDRGKEDLP